jgi:hypothetical protein
LVKLLEEFDAVGADGARHVVQAWGDQIPTDPPTGKRTLHLGSVDYRLADGRDLNPVGLDDNVWQIVDSEELIKRA